MRLSAALDRVKLAIREDQIGQLLTMLVEVQAGLAPALRFLAAASGAQRYGWLTVEERLKPRFARVPPPIPRLCWVTLSANGVLSYAASSGLRRSIFLPKFNAPKLSSVSAASLLLTR